MVENGPTRCGEIANTAHGPRVQARSAHELAGEGLGEIDVLVLHVAVDRAHHFQHGGRPGMRHAAVEREHRLGRIDRLDIERAVAGVVLRGHRRRDLLGAVRMDVDQCVHQRIDHALDLRAVAIGPRAVQVEAGRRIQPAQRSRRRLGSAQVDQELCLAAFQQPRNRRLGGHAGIDRAFAHRGDEAVARPSRNQVDLGRLQSVGQHEIVREEAGRRAKAGDADDAASQVGGRAKRRGAARRHQQRLARRDGELHHRLDQLALRLQRDGVIVEADHALHRA